MIYAIDADSPRHRAARQWLEETLSGTTRVGLAWIVILAFVPLQGR
ncbi:MAG: type II toxin-antitoxin system VapC family toxin [bacterium]|nr:type II toxin-antitoxin system VapC family toxin [bacterium]